MNEVESEADMNDCIETVVNACAIFGDSVTRHDMHNIWGFYPTSVEKIN